ncbi:T9SS type A sorting domain-containing protein [Flavobacterium sp. DGU11]|uniref:T9SS type A sorting domain-containing protein n=1 Tax=Flavobacterium arundinis TaxID=3139143 RepID=A0ABU9HUG8_9FLAO
MIKKLLFAILFSACFTSLHAQGVVCITVFNDLNGDGVQTASQGESGVEGVAIVIVAAPASFPHPLPYAMYTDATGNYCFTDLDNGQYNFALEVPEGWNYSGDPFFTVNVTDGGANNFRFGVMEAMATRGHEMTKLKAYPNPASTFLTIQSQTTEVGAEIMIYDLSGKWLSSQKLTGTNTNVDVSQLATGFYIAKFKFGNVSQNLKFAIAR